MKWFPALMGGFGVLMGFSAFVLLRQEREKVDSPYVFFFGLLAAVLTSFVIESVRARRGQRCKAVALGFGSAQVRLRLAELARGEKLSANAEAVRHLELALGASFAFWATAGLLAGSAGQRPVDGARERDSPAR